ncbi:hypothetical protein HNP48_006541 [Acidovorax soli]|uniref:Uncharacterized protein n=1 Tax=Acidovorax soli TaxID=592050 RepID=A0A7X0PKU8_9BURK|nr:hypothetical protein [Acidovorax soli]MBB6563815.1 hypothetical protein [Acidovorax soli]
MGKRMAAALVAALALAAGAAEKLAPGKLVEAVSAQVQGASARAGRSVELLADFQAPAAAGLFPQADEAAAAVGSAAAALQRIDASARPELATASLNYLKAAQNLVKDLQDARRKASHAEALDREGARIAAELKDARDSDRPALLERMEKAFGQSDDAEAAMKEAVTRASAALAELVLRRSLLAAQLGSADALLPEKTLAAVRQGLQAVQPAE